MEEIYVVLDDNGKLLGVCAEFEEAKHIVSDITMTSDYTNEGLRIVCVEIGGYDEKGFLQ